MDGDVLTSDGIKVILKWQQKTINLSKNSIYSQLKKKCREKDLLLGPKATDEDLQVTDECVVD